jgi:hypothetical protein
MEVAALQAFHEFRLTPAQLESLRKIAKETAAEPSSRQAAAASAEYRNTLVALRDALVDDTDDDLIDELQEQLDDLREKEKLEFDDGIDVTDEARQRVPELLGTLSPRQIAHFLAAHADDVPEPLEWILAALDKVRDLNAKEWKALREAISEDVGRAVAGLDAEKASQVSDKVIQLLIQVRALKDDAFKAQRPDLEKMAREIVGPLGPLDVLRNVLAQELAELLSNPRLSAAIDARLKK